jgi:type IV secretory pathway VirB4 component
MNILGTSGSGKSVTAKLMAIRFWLRQVQILVLDPEGEYKKLTKAVGGETIKFSREEGINPFFTGDEDGDFNDHIQTLKEFFKFFIPNDHYDQATLDEALVSIYSEGNPNYQNLLKKLDKSPMCRDLRVLETGSLAGIFNSTRKINLKNDWLVFDLSGMESEEHKKPAMYLLASMISRMIKKAERKRMMFIDEAHVFLEDYNTALFYKNLVKRARKYNTGVVSITQNIEDYFHDKWGLGKGIITNAETTFLLKQSFASLDIITDSFPITDNEKTLLPTLAQGEALLFRENEHMRINLIPLQTEQPLVFT